MSDQIVNQDALRREATTILDHARSLVVDSESAAKEAAGVLSAIKAMRKKVAEIFDPVIERAHQAHKSAIAARRSVDDPLVECEMAIKSKLAQWQAENERRRREEEERLAAEIKKQEEERRLAAALQAEEFGDVEMAEAIIEEPIVTPAVSIARPKIAGVSFREEWSAEVTNLFALVRHVAAHPELINMLAPNQTALNAMARAQKAAMSLPGVKAVCRQVVSGRTAS